MPHTDRDEVLSRLARIEELLSQLEQLCGESLDQRVAFSKLKEQIDAAHRALHLHRR